MTGAAYGYCGVCEKSLREGETCCPDIDPLVEQVQDECPTCGAYVLNHALHADFHRRQRQQFMDLDRLARSYVDPPRYG